MSFTEPATLEAVIVYRPATATAVGVPVIAQVVWSKVKPAGSGGLEVQEDGVPPPPANVGVIFALTILEMI